MGCGKSHPEVKDLACLFTTVVNIISLEGTDHVFRRENNEEEVAPKQYGVELTKVNKWSWLYHVTQVEGEPKVKGTDT